MIRLRKNRAGGFALMTVIFLLFIASMAVASMWQLSSNQTSVKALTGLSLRAQQAAASGLSWAVHVVRERGQCDAMTKLSFSDQPLQGFVVEVTCEPVTNPTIERSIRIQSVAQWGDSRAHADYVRRTASRLVKLSDSAWGLSE